MGLSPRGRGNRHTRYRHPSPEGSIPAWAGQPRRTDSSFRSPGVYPRVGGATHVAALGQLALHGLSPRGAGQPEVSHYLLLANKVYPRVGGATHVPPGQALAARGLSPRGRGNQFVVVEWDAVGRSIPAWAGQPGPNIQAIGIEEVYPRVGGATAC